MVKKLLKIVNDGEHENLQIYDGEVLLLDLRSSNYYLTEEAIASTLRMLGYLVTVEEIEPE